MTATVAAGPDLDTPEWRQYLAWRDRVEAAKVQQPYDDRPFMHVPYDHPKERP